MAGLARVAVVAALALLACDPPDAGAGKVEGPYTWGAVSNVTRLGHLWLSGQPDDAALQKAQAEGVRVVISLRDPSEHDWDEQGAVEELGMIYYNVPVARKKPFERSALEKVEALVEEHVEGQVWIHCSTSNRAGAWLATHLVETRGMSLEDALDHGRQAGIAKDATEANVRAYLGP